MSGTQVYSYAPDSDSWETLAALKSPRQGLHLVAAADRLLVFGGYEQHGRGSAKVLSTVEQYVLSTPRSWTEASELRTTNGEALQLLRALVSIAAAPQVLQWKAASHL